MTLSVVIACIDADRTIERCLDAIELACEGLAAEVFVVHPSDTELTDRVRRAHPRVAVIAAAPDALVPELWARGMDASSGAAVAFTTGHCVVPPGWAHGLLAALAGGATGAGGCLELAPDTGIVDWAVFFLRYSAFIPPHRAGEVAEIPGDNAAYLRLALDRHRHTFMDGFWEVDFHRLLRTEGGVLVHVPESSVTFGRSFTFGRILRHRFLHGRHFGHYRVSVAGAPWWRGIGAAPVVPALLVWRVLRRVARRPELRTRALFALPVLLPLAAAWAAGEAAGALAARRGDATS